MAYNLEEFTSSEIIDGWESRKVREFGPAFPFIQEVAEEGRDKDALSLVGWFQPGKAAEKDVPTYVPWFVYDVDRTSESLGAAYEDTKALLMKLEDEGIDLDRTYASFSGRRGFHIHIEASMFGNPVFKSHRHARKTLSSIFGRIAEDIEVDPCVWNPLRPIRLTGATHSESGGRKFTIGAYDFITSPGAVQEAVEQAKAGVLPAVWEWPDPRKGEPVEALRARMGKEWKQIDKSLNGYAGKQKKATRGRHSVMPYPTYKAWQGVEKSSPFAFGHVGRDNAAFMLACYFLENGRTPEETFKILKKWDAERNTPPLQDDLDEPADVLTVKVNSAVDTLFDKNKIDHLQTI
ncbi:hypothetical protein [Salinibacter phage M8CRM-1]|uniref:DNA primase n=1 Tax=Salinibacter phage M8CRM-1 TaxID=2681612 RepID=A0A2I6UGP1_9CAUD|nr:hypothetical protein FGG67_gp39 [Salinibacter phage M8CRM-1]AUO79121.1 hypothetical protein [Salinibacter phage M8CRM-1]